MLRETKKLFFIFVICLFIFFTGKYYFSDDNKKKFFRKKENKFLTGSNKNSLYLRNKYNFRFNKVARFY